MKEQKIYLQHIIAAINEITKFTKGRVRDIGILGEAARYLGRDFHQKIPNIPWSNIIGMGNKISHDYFEVDAEVVWLAVEEDLPVLETRFRKF